MAGIFGHLGVSDRERVFAATPGQRVIWETATEWVADRQAELDAAMGVLVSGMTEEYKLRYKLPGAGYLQTRGPDGSYRAVKAAGQWDVALPLRDYGAMIGGNDVAMAYMTMRDLENHLLTVASMNVATVRRLVLRAIFNNAGETFADDDHGNLSVVPLANGDSVVYPPIQGSDTEATEDHYLVSGYAASAISATNNPVVTIRDELMEHWGEVATGTNIIVFYHPDEDPELKAISGWTPVSDRYIQEGDDTAVVSGAPAAHPGVLTARFEQCWMVKWRHIPSGYLFGIDMDRPAPEQKRVDPADTGLPQGLTLVAEDEEFPFKESYWRHRMGYAVTNRLNGVVMQCKASGTYDIPTGYS